MTLIDWIVNLATSGVVAGVAVAVAKPWIQKAIEHRYDAKLEELKARLSSNEGELVAIRSGALSNLASRNEELDRRRINAIEAVMTFANELLKDQMAVAVAGMLKFENIAKEIKNNTSDGNKIRAVVGDVSSALNLDGLKNQSDVIENRKYASIERLYVNDRSWQLYAILGAISARAKLLLLCIKFGAPLTLVVSEKDTNEKIASLFPHMEKFVSENPDSAMFYLQKFVYDELFKELHAQIDGGTVDKNTVKSAHAIVAEAKAQIASLVDDKDAAALSQVWEQIPKELRKS